MELEFSQGIEINIFSVPKLLLQLQLNAVYFSASCPKLGCIVVHCYTAATFYLTVMIEIILIYKRLKPEFIEVGGKTHPDSSVSVGIVP